MFHRHIFLFSRFRICVSYLSYAGNSILWILYTYTATMLIILHFTYIYMYFIWYIQIIYNLNIRIRLCSYWIINSASVDIGNRTSGSYLLSTTLFGTLHRKMNGPAIYIELWSMNYWTSHFICFAKNKSDAKMQNGLQIHVSQSTAHCAFFNELYLPFSWVIFSGSSRMLNESRLTCKTVNSF